MNAGGLGGGSDLWVVEPSRAARLASERAAALWAAEDRAWTRWVRACERHDQAVRDGASAMREARYRVRSAMQPWSPQAYAKVIAAHADRSAAWWARSHTDPQLVGKVMRRVRDAEAHERQVAKRHGDRLATARADRAVARRALVGLRPDLAR